MKKQIYTLATILMMSLTAQAQVGIGTSTPTSSSMLDVTSTTRGFLMPRMTTTERTTISSPTAGLQVYDTVTNTIWYHNGTVWVNSGINAVEPWFNQATNAGATSNTQNIYQMGNVGIGTATPNQKLEVAGFIQTFANGGGATAFRAISGTNALPGADLRVQNNVGAGTIGMVSNHPLEFMTNSTVRATVTAAGNIGIGTGAPANRFEVTSASASTSGIRMTNLTTAVTTKAASAATLGVDSNGDVVIASNAASTAAKNFIYMPSIAIDVSANVTGATKNLYSLYSAQFTTPKAASTGAPTAIPVLPAATDFYYYVTYADPAVFTGTMSIDASGMLTYNVTASAVTDATFINIVLVPKN